MMSPPVEALRKEKISIWVDSIGRGGERDLWMELRWLAIDLISMHLWGEKVAYKTLISKEDRQLMCIGQQYFLDGKIADPSLAMAEMQLLVATNYNRYRTKSSPKTKDQDMEFDDLVTLSGPVVLTVLRSANL
jgi:hypothetical protein